MDRNMPAPGMTDGVGLVLDGDGLLRLEPAVTQFLEERQQPAFTGECCSGV